MSLVKKHRCVLGVLKTQQGLKIKDEMLTWLSKYYDVITVEQEAPGELFELPGLAMAAELCYITHEPVLYLHTKGAAMQNNAQPMVRKCWEIEFGENRETYFELVNTDRPTVAAPLVAKKNHVCWFNGFVMNYMAAYGHACSGGIRDILDVKEDRYWFEQGMLKDIIVDVKSPYEDGVAETGEAAWPTFVNMYKKYWTNPVSEIPKKAKVESRKEDFAICAIVKDEDPYMLDWLTYYRKLGCKRFYILDNYDEPFNWLENFCYGQNRLHNDVTHFNIRGREALAKVGFQAGAYQTIFNTFKDRHEYIGFFDIDEFLNLNGKTWQEWVQEHSDVAANDAIHFNWRYFGDNDLLEYENKPVWERFTKPCPIDVKYAQDFCENFYTKVILKCTEKSLGHHGIHSAIFAVSSPLYDREATYVTSTGKPMTIFGQNHEIDYSNGCVDHYGTKTITEYINKRCLKTEWAVNDDKHSAEERIKWFFNVNKDTPEKREIIKNMLGEDFNWEK